LSEIYLLDTDSYSFLGEDDSEILAHIRALAPGDKVHISFVTVGEWEYGYYNTLNPALRSKIRTSGDKAFDYMDSVIPSSQDIGTAYGQIRADLRRAGTMIPQNDMWIAAAALAIGATLVTHDGHFKHVANLAVVDWTVP